MIRLMIGKMGSGKTLSMVREMVVNDDEKITFSNITIKGREAKKKNRIINRDMIFKEKVIKTKVNGEPVTKLVLNVDFWKNIREQYPQGINVVLDEAHTLINSRRAMSKENVIMNDFMALLRRILGDSGGYGELVLITQLGRRLDVNARELTTNVHYHICHYKRTCKKCGFSFSENNEIFDKPKKCPRCNGARLVSTDHVIEKWEFSSMDDVDVWMMTKRKIYQKHYYIMDAVKYFKYYDTFSWENLISEY